MAFKTKKKRKNVSLMDSKGLAKTIGWISYRFGVSDGKKGIKLEKGVGIDYKRGYNEGKMLSKMRK